MVLETLDIELNDIFIYSENKFDLEKNFKLIEKDAKEKCAVNIHYNDVCSYLADKQPKNTILYRLLTNSPNFNLEFIKYGYFLKVNGVTEVIYFDPIFAINEIQEFTPHGDDEDLRFRIQQVGLTMIPGDSEFPNYKEVYCFDLEAPEVQWQNDRVFAEIIFAFEDVDFDQGALGKKSPIREPAEYEIPKGKAKKKFVTLCSDDLDFGKINSKAISLLKPEEIKEEAKFSTLPSQKSGIRIFEEDKVFDPINAKKMEVINFQPPQVRPDRRRMTDPRSLNFQVIKKLEDDAKTDLGTSKKGVEKQDNFLQMKSKNPVVREKEGSAFTSFLSKKREDVVSKNIDTEKKDIKNEEITSGKIGELTESLGQFISDKEKRPVVLKFKRI